MGEYIDKAAFVREIEKSRLMAREPAARRILEIINGMTVFAGIGLNADVELARRMDTEVKKMKGATKFDTLCHRVFDAEAHGMDYLSLDTHIRCKICGFSLCAYYCEEQLFLVECEHCHKKALVKAGNPKIAAYETFGEDGTVKCD